jgi:hypothetical protein
MGEVELKPGWQPIESAPKDGDPLILSAGDKRMRVAFFNRAWGVWCDEFSNNVVGGDYKFWMRPEPPAKP